LTRIVVLLSTVLAAVALAGRAQAAVYYVSSQGDDTKAGTSPATAWRTLQKVNNTQLKPGDSVLLQGGQTFDGPLVPWGSGKQGKPVVFASYGSGKATIASSNNNIVFFHAVSWVTLQNLKLTANGTDDHIVASDPTTTSAYITLQNDLITNTAAFGINSPSLTDHDWTITGNTISETNETGITFRGANFKVIGNVVQDTGLHPSEGAHGVYAKGPSAQVIGNTITNFNASGVSIRYQNSQVIGNAISNGMIGISYFQDADVKSGGTSTIAYNKIFNVSLAGMYLDGGTLESFVIANNTVWTLGGNAINVRPVKSLTLVNNIFTGTFDDYAGLLTKPTKSFTEGRNLWFPGSGPVLLWQGAARTLGQYQAASHQGSGDLTVDPLLDSSLFPSASSPVIDAGVTVKGLPYAATCNGTAFSYCDRAPDIGASERKKRKRSPVRR